MDKVAAVTAMNATTCVDGYATVVAMAMVVVLVVVMACCAYVRVACHARRMFNATCAQVAFEIHTTPDLSNQPQNAAMPQRRAHRKAAQPQTRKAANAAQLQRREAATLPGQRNAGTRNARP